MPKVSVITPNYNHARYLHQRLDSILNQTFQDFELIILDDASTDLDDSPRPHDQKSLVCRFTLPLGMIDWTSTVYPAAKETSTARNPGGVTPYPFAAM